MARSTKASKTKTDRASSASGDESAYDSGYGSSVEDASHTQKKRKTSVASRGPTTQAARRTSPRATRTEDAALEDPVAGRPLADDEWEDLLEATERCLPKPVSKRTTAPSYIEESLDKLSQVKLPISFAQQFVSEIPTEGSKGSRSGLAIQDTTKSVYAEDDAVYLRRMREKAAERTVRYAIESTRNFWQCMTEHPETMKSYMYKNEEAYENARAHFKAEKEVPLSQKQWTFDDVEDDLRFDKGTFDRAAATAAQSLVSRMDEFVPTVIREMDRRSTVSLQRDFQHKPDTEEAWTELDTAQRPDIKETRVVSSNVRTLILRGTNADEPLKMVLRAELKDRDTDQPYGKFESGVVSLDQPESILADRIAETHTSLLATTDSSFNIADQWDTWTKAADKESKKAKRRLLNLRNTIELQMPSKHLDEESRELGQRLGKAMMSEVDFSGEQPTLSSRFSKLSKTFKSSWKGRRIIDMAETEVQHQLENLARSGQISAERGQKAFASKRGGRRSKSKKRGSKA